LADLIWDALRHIPRLFRAARTFARYDVLSPEQVENLPGPARLGYRLLKPAMAQRRGGLAAALSELGPSYIKLGQFLATRPDIVGAERAAELRMLHDRLPPFAMAEAEAAVESALGAAPSSVFQDFGPPVAAASIAQVHRARLEDGRYVAVKILRPGIEKRFADDLASFFFVAKLLERASAEARRLRPVDAVTTLARSVALEMDLRMEAAAISEMGRNTEADPDFRTPKVEWPLTARRVLTCEWIEGTSLADLDALQTRGIDLPDLARSLVQNFLRHAIRDGFFHADMHQGNLFVDEMGRLAAVDFGIMGRLSPKERRFLAEILYGFITRDYLRVAVVHFEAGYLPAHHEPATFAQALRAIGEPIMDRPAHEISMARLLTQLFEVTAQFDMTTQPRLLLLQKTMVVVEGVARTLDPYFNMWTASEPVVREWIERHLGPAGAIEESAKGAVTMGRLLADLPEAMLEVRQASRLLADMAASGGVRLAPQSTEALALAQLHQTRANRYALWVGAAALVVIALALVV
jgi:ubiquinone biosynthesis protein